MNQVVKIGIERQYHWRKAKYRSFIFHFIYLHEIHVVQSNVVELCVLDDGGGARVVGGIDQGQHLVTAECYKL